jgi:aminoglycoside/choline kinase family phosphotransferase
VDSDTRAFILGFLKEKGPWEEPISLEPVPGEGSVRRFWRIRSAGSRTGFLVMTHPPKDDMARRENLAYVMIGKHLHGKGLPLPKIHRHHLDRGWVILEDMGETNLQEVVLSASDPAPIYRRVVEQLFRLQVRGAEGFDPAWCCQTERYDRRVMRLFETDYFRDAFLCRYLGLKAEWPELEEAFDHLAESASGSEDHFFLHRDFQSRNILVAGECFAFIDWQGGRLGPLGYDLASLLIDPYTALSPEARTAVYDHYLAMIRQHHPGSLAPFKRHYPYLAILRNLQILGAFAFLTRERKKTRFEAYILPALESLHDLIREQPDAPLEPLRSVVGEIRSKALDRKERAK